MSERWQPTMQLQYLDGALHQKWTRGRFENGNWLPPEEEWRPVPGKDNPEGTK